MHSLSRYEKDGGTVRIAYQPQERVLPQLLPLSAAAKTSLNQQQAARKYCINSSLLSKMPVLLAARH